MPEKHQPLFNTAYLRSVWAREYEEFKNSPEANGLLTRITHWSAKQRQKETTAEAAFIDVFFKQTWGYRASGEGEKDHGFTLYPQYPIKNAGQKGGTGTADIALGYFSQKDMEEIPQEGYFGARLVDSQFSLNGAIDINLNLIYHIS